MSRSINVSVPHFIHVRDAFSWEDRSFTPWLEENIQALSDRLGGLELTVEEREKSIGDFKADLVCTDKHGRRVIIENQLEPTDHSHAGQVLVYLVNLDAHTAIWVSPDPRNEHIEVMKWLNRITDDDMSFFLVKLEAVKIDDPEHEGVSFCAPIFTPVVWPDAQVKEYGRTTKELSERHHARLAFWEQFLSLAQERGARSFAGRRTPPKEHWISCGAGKSNVHFSCNIYADGASVTLWIDYDQQTGRLNKEIFDRLLKDREAIEAEIQATLSWDRGESKRSCEIGLRLDVDGGLYDKDSWPAVQEQMLVYAERFYKTFRPRLETMAI